jgi:hypothetical protein
VKEALPVKGDDVADEAVGGAVEDGHGVLLSSAPAGAAALRGRGLSMAVRRGCDVDQLEHVQAQQIGCAL